MVNRIGDQTGIGYSTGIPDRNLTVIPWQEDGPGKGRQGRNVKPVQMRTGSGGLRRVSEALLSSHVVASIFSTFARELSAIVRF